MSARGNKNGKPAAKVRPVGLTVRPARSSDLVPLAFFFDTALRNDYFMRRGQLEDMLSDPYHDVYVAEFDTILVGIAITTRGSHLANALVHPAYRGLGVGRALVQSSSARSVSVKLDMQSGDPSGFYRALGFKPTGRFNDRGNIELMHLTNDSPAGRRRASSTAPKRTAQAH